MNDGDGSEESKKKTRRVVRLEDDTTTTWCSKTHDLVEIDLEEQGDRPNVLVGDCPRCDARYTSKKTWGDPQFGAQG